jgi:dolichol-phosphate mannosyltransferase
LTPRPYPVRLSLVIPVYNEEQVLPLLREEIRRFSAALPCALEVVLVNDGSRDRTIELLAAWAQDDPAIAVLDLSRNFGHQVAATAGLDHATGDAVVLMDADLQDPLDVVHDMIRRYREGYDVVYGQRVVREGEGLWKRASAWLFYRLMRTMVYKDLPPDTGDFRLVSRRALDSLIAMREQHRFLRGMACWVGYPQVSQPYNRARRAAGTTKYPFRKMLLLAWTAATSFSALPLRISLLLGFAVGLLGIEEGVRAIVVFLQGGNVPGWTSLMLVTCAIGSSLLIAISVVGDYVGKIFEQVKQRPIYIVARRFSAAGEAPAACEEGSAVKLREH